MKNLLALSLLIGTSSMVSAAQYYNCATNTGCVATGNITVSSSYAKTQNPVVLAHGIAGFSNIAGVDYFYGVPADLTANGAKVFVSLASSFNASGDVRGEQLLRQVEIISALNQGRKVNLIGHSQGGLDSRYVAGVKPQLVASVTSVGTPHTGTAVADLVLKVAKGEPTGLLQSVASGIVNVAAKLITGLSGGNYDQNSLGALDTLSTAGSAKFNQRFPAGLPTTACGTGATSHNGIKLYSWGGTQPLTNVLDPLDVLFGTSSLAFMGKASDGMVERCSNHFGQIIRDNYAMNHGDLVNQVLGLTYLFETSPKTVYRQHVNRLKNAGL